MTVSATLAATVGDKNRHVVLITLDGFPAYLWHDASIPLPNLRKLAAGGSVAEAMTIVNPTVTWPNHTTLVTGVTPQKHGVLYNALVTRQGPGKPIKSEQWADKDRLVRIPTVYDAVFQAGLTTAEVDWVAISRPQTITWSYGEVPDPTSPLIQEMVAAGVVTQEEVSPELKRNIVWRDERWLRAGQFVFERHQPNLLLLHFLNTDSTHHRYGPGSAPSIVALALADRLVGEMLRTIEASGKGPETTVIVTTDHGFKKVSTWIYPNVILRRAGLLTAGGARVASSDVYVGTQGGVAFVYVTDPAKRAELLPKLKTLFSAAEGVERVVDGADAHSLGMPTPEENEGMGDLILYPKAGHSFSGSAVGDLVVGPSIDYGGSHGFLASDPELNGIFIASGAGIRKGQTIPVVRNIDVAPTIARLLSVPLPTADGKPIEEILQSPSSR